MKLQTASIVSFALFLVTLAVNISMPLFRPYAEMAGLNNGQTALVLATYIVGMLPCYIFLGGVSDRIGRKPVLLFSLFLALASNLTITLFPNVFALIFARFFQGVALALSMGTGTAFIAELVSSDSHAAVKAANVTSMATAIGFSGGAFMTSIALLIHFTYLPITYFVAITITIIGIVLTFSLPKLPPIGGNLVRLPYFPKGSLLVNLSIAICWATTGVVIAIIPTQLATYHLTAYAGFCLVLINWTGGFMQPFIRKRFQPKTSLKLGFAIIPFGFGLVILGSYLGVLLVVLLGTAFIGSAAYGFSYQGGLAIIADLGGSQKARAVSGYMFFGYVGFGIPAILLGFLADSIGIIASLLVFELLIVLLSLYLYLRFDRDTSR
jgi:MFS family permease